MGNEERIATSTARPTLDLIQDTGENNENARLRIYRFASDAEPCPTHAEQRKRLNAVNNAQRWELCRGTTVLCPHACSREAWRESLAPPRHASARDSA